MAAWLTLLQALLETDSRHVTFLTLTPSLTPTLTEALLEGNSRHAPLTLTLTPSLMLNLTQALLEGDSRHVGAGVVRDVYLAKYEGQLVAVKTLKEPAGIHDIDERWAERKLQHWAEIVAMDAVRYEMI